MGYSIWSRERNRSSNVDLESIGNWTRYSGGGNTWIFRNNYDGFAWQCWWGTDILGGSISYGRERELASNELEQWDQCK